MSILDTNIGDTLMILGDEYNVQIKMPASVNEYQYRYAEWDWMDHYRSLEGMVAKIRQDISNIPMEKFKTYTRYAQIKKILRRHLHTNHWSEKWELSSKRTYGMNPFDWDRVQIRLSSPARFDCMFSKDKIQLIDIVIFKRKNYGHPF